MSTPVLESTATFGNGTHPSEVRVFGRYASAATTDIRARVSPWAVTKQKIDDWSKGHSSLRADDLTPPSSLALKCAMDIAERLRELNVAAPTRVVPDGDGGIALEREIGDRLEAIEIAPDGSIELLTFERGQLVRRRRS